MLVPYLILRSTTKMPTTKKHYGPYYLSESHPMNAANTTAVEIVRNGHAVDLYAMQPAETWHEDYGDVLWWHWPIEEPPHVGTPHDCNKYGEPGYIAKQQGIWLTHWSPLPDCHKYYLAEDGKCK